MSKGLEHYCVEHVPRVYKIYSDGEVQTVMGYAGLGGLYNETMKTIYEEEIARGVDIQSRTHITSDINFHKMLVEQLNQDNIAKVEREQAQLLSVRNTMKEEVQPLVKSMQRVITTINFCCRVDLEDGSIYIGEGYENYTSFYNGERAGVTTTVENNFLATATVTGNASTMYSVFMNSGSEINQQYTINYEILEGVNFFDRVAFLNNDTGVTIINRELSGSITQVSMSSAFNNFNTYFKASSTIGDYIKYKVNVTKTSTPKPFVKSHMPVGKLAFITNATSETHSFVMKGIPKQENKEYSVFLINSVENVYAKVMENNSSIIFSSLYKRLLPQNIDLRGGSARKKILSLCFSGNVSNDSFSQLLIYKGNFTQAELEGELAKNIKLK